jgi:hypothetical protein
VKIIRFKNVFENFQDKQTENLVKKTGKINRPGIFLSSVNRMSCFTYFAKKIESDAINFNKL